MNDSMGLSLRNDATQAFDKHFFFFFFFVVISAFS